MNIAKLAILASVCFQETAAADLPVNNEGSYYSNDVVEDDTLDLALDLKSYSYSYYSGYYNYYNYGGYNNYNSGIDWGWFFIILLCCPAICYFKYCHKEQHHVDEHHDEHSVNAVYIDNNFQNVAGTGTATATYAQNPAMM